ncbi:MAG: hypothetical protein ABIJ14_00940 [Nanoarchaeota archaeon]
MVDNKNSREAYFALKDGKTFYIDISKGKVTLYEASVLKGGKDISRKLEFAKMSDLELFDKALEDYKIRQHMESLLVE